MFFVIYACIRGLLVKKGAIGQSVDFIPKFNLLKKLEKGKYPLFL